MSLNLTEIDLSISEKLQPLRDTLEELQIPVACLPKEAGKYSSEDMGAISIMIPQCNGVQPAPENLGIQEVSYLVVIHLTLGKRYQDNPEERDVIEWVSDRITFLLLGFNPMVTDKSLIRRPLWFDSYSLLQPTNGRWEAELRFQFSRLLVTPVEFIDDNTPVQSIELFSSRTLTALDATLLTKLPK